MATRPYHLGMPTDMCEQQVSVSCGCSFPCEMDVGHDGEHEIWQTNCDRFDEMTEFGEWLHEGQRRGWIKIGDR